MDSKQKVFNWFILFVILVIIFLLAWPLIFSEDQLFPEDQPISRGTSVGYGWIREETFTVTATGSAGSATGTQTSDGYVRGHVYAVYLDYGSSISATTDLTITTNSSPAANALNILVATNTVTDGWYYPVIQQTDNTGSGTSTYDRAPVNDILSASVAQSTATDVVTVTVYFGQ